jgi:hypothetical protein
MEACFKAVLDQCEETRSTRTARPVAAASVEERAPATDESPSAAMIGGRVLTNAEIDRLVAPRYQVAVTVCKQCKQGWQHGACGTTLLTPPELERACCDSVHVGSIDDEPGRAARSIPPALKRRVLHRDGYCCRVPGCTATANVDVHHMWFLMYGGKNTLANLITLCEGHHLALHDGGLVIEGDALNPKFVFKPQNNFKLASRAVECAAALRARGVARELIKVAVDATRTHVGTQDFTTQQWLDIALSKLPTQDLER